MIVDEGLSHNEIQLRLNLPPSTYFRYLDTLFKAEQEAISGNNYTYQRLLNESLTLGQGYLHQARKLTIIGDDEKIDPEQRIQAHVNAAQVERAVHDISYMAPSYLRRQGLLPDAPEGRVPVLTMSKIEPDEVEDPYEKERIKVAGEYRQEQHHHHHHQQKNKKIISSSTSTSTTNPLANTEDTYDKVQKNKKKLEEDQWR